MRPIPLVLGVALVACAHHAPQPSAAKATSTVTAPTTPATLERLLDKPSDHLAVVGRNVYVDGSGPLLISRDGGKTFAPWSADPTLCVTSFVAAPRDGVLYAVAATCPETDVQTAPDHLYVSTDEGGTWKELDATPEFLDGVDPHDARIVYGHLCVGGADACRSVDGGVTWQPLVGPSASAQTDLFVADDGSLYAQRPRDRGYELDRSKDGGRSWSPVVDAEAAADVGVEAVLDDGTLLGVDLDACGLLRSSSGKPFERVLAPDEGCEPGSSIIGHGAHACAIFADDEIFASADHGATWQRVDVPPIQDSHLRYACLPDGDRLLVTAADGLFEVAAPWAR